MVPSFIRTFVPMIVGGFVTWLAARGWTIDPDTEVAIVSALTGLIGAAYYAVVRLLEARWPWVGWLLGKVGAPTYEAKHLA